MTLSRFSFNAKGGRCKHRQGRWVHQDRDAFPRSTCTSSARSREGKRYNRETLDITYKGKNIADVLDMAIDEASRFSGTSRHCPSQARNAVGRRARVFAAGAIGGDLVRRRGAAAEAGFRAGAAGDGADGVRARRAEDGILFRRHSQASPKC